MEVNNPLLIAYNAPQKYRVGSQWDRHYVDGTADHAVAQSLLDRFGTLLLSEGDFYFEAALRMAELYQVHGSGFGLTRIHTTGRTNGIEVADDTEDNQRGEISRLEVLGNPSAQHGLYLVGAKNWRLTDVKVRAFTQTGYSSVYLSGNEGVRVGCFYNEFRGCEIRGSTYGVTYTGVTADGQANANHWYGGKMQAHARAINCEQPSQGNTFHHPSIEDCGGGTLFYSDGRGNILQCGYLESTDATYVEFGPNSTWNSVYDLPFVPASSVPIVPNGIQNYVTFVRQENARQHRFEGTLEWASLDGVVVNNFG